MKTFTAEEIKKLKAAGRVSEKEYLKIALAPKKKVEPPAPKNDSLSDILQSLNRLITLQEADLKRPEEPVVVHAAAPTVNVTLPEEKEEEKEKWHFTVERDSRGFISSVSAVQV